MQQCLWMLCMLPLQFTSLLPLSVAFYAATIAAFTVALLARPGRFQAMNNLFPTRVRVVGE